MYLANETVKQSQSLQLMRFLHLLEVLVYGGWWFIIEYTQPAAYNPIWSRLLVIIPPFLVFLLSYRVKWVAENLESLFYASLYVLLAHNFYAKHMNYDDVAWPVATYITITTVCASFQSPRALAIYSVYTVVLGTWVAKAHSFVYPFYIPGLISIVLVMNVLLHYRSRAIRELEESRARFEKLFNAVFEGIALHEDGVILAANDSFVRMFGGDRSLLIGNPIINLVADESLPDVLDRMANYREAPYEAWGKRWDGEVFPVEISMKRHVFEGREVRMVAVRDMQERHRAESERQKKLEAQAAVELRDQFISIASHELRTPLTPIKLANDILLSVTKAQGSSSLSEGQIIKMLETTASQIGRLTRLIDDMLDVSRMNTGHFALQLESFDLAEVLGEIVRLYSAESSHRRSTLRLRMPKSLPWVRWDRLRMEQVFTNLVKNALIYGDGKNILISVRKVHGRVVLAVRDHGIGIEQQQLSKIFGRYERAVSGKNYGGLGLGLYISQQIVHAHQGQIRAKSFLGKGSCFTVVMPMQAEPAQVSFAPQSTVSQTVSLGAMS